MFGTVVFSDIDGTLLNSMHQVTETTAREIRRIDGLGVPFVLVSARSPRAMLPIRQTLGIHAPMVCYSGAMALDADGTVLESRTIPVGQAAQVKECVAEYFPEVVCNIYAGESWSVDDDTHPIVREEERITGLKALVGGFERGIFDATGVHKLLMIGESAAAMLQVQDRLREKFPKLTVVLSAACYLEVMAEGVNKSAGMKAVCRHFGCSLENTVAFGDGFNDVDMLQAAGRGYAMANAPQEVRTCTGYLAEANDSNGLAKVLQELF